MSVKDLAEKALEFSTYKINGKEVTREYFEEQVYHYSILIGLTYIKTTWDDEQKKSCCELLVLEAKEQ